MSILTSEDFALQMLSAARTQRYPLTGCGELSLKGGRFGDGTAELEFDMGRPWTTWMKMTNVEELYEYSVDVFYRSLTVPFVTLVPIKPQFIDTSQRMVKVEYEYILGHGLRRRLDYKSGVSNADASTTGKPDDIAKAYMRAAVGGTTPLGYPATRSDYNNWAFACAADAGAHASTVTFSGEAGKNTHDVVTRLCEQYDMYPTIVESSAASWTYDIDVPYQENDKTETVILTPLRGNALEIGFESPYEQISNVWMIGGDGQGAGQTVTWAQNTASTGPYGVYEDRKTSPKGDSTRVGVDADYLQSIYGPLRQTYWVKVRDVTNCVFGRDYGLRSKVRIYTDAYSRTVDMVIVGYDLKVNCRTGRYEVDLELGYPRRNVLREMLEMTGTMSGGRGSGGRWLRNGGN